MNKRPGQLNVTTEVAYCSFCARPRTLRREERQLGALVRTTITCETCHRTLESSVTVADATAPEVEKEAAAPMARPPKTADEPAMEPRPRARATASTAPAAKPKPGTKPKTTTTARRTAKGK